MRNLFGRPPFITFIAALLLVALSLSDAVVTGSIPESSVSPSKLKPSTCPSRSLNYITQTLARQCLTTSWASRPTGSENATDSPVSTLSSTYSRVSNTTTVTTTLATSSTNEIGQDTVSSIAPATTNVSITTRPSISPSPHIAVASSVQGLAPTGGADQQADAESPLDNVNFLSFEEWKRQNLAKAGQSAENLGSKAGENGPRRRPGAINNALDSLGEDAEIEIDFGGFIDPRTSHDTVSPTRREGDVDDASKTNAGRDHTIADESSSAHTKGKDAGKTCKERSNYASFDCAATMLKTNAESKGSNAVLVENKDSYMLNTCSAKNKFFIVELCDDILVDTVVLANFEFFSSMFRTFRVSVSDRYPVKPDKWRDLGTHEARNSRDIQAFLIENPLIWARYLRIEFLTHFGNEYYCPVSLLRVHGTTMMEEFNHDLKRSSTEEDAENDSGENEDEVDVETSSRVPGAQTLGENPGSSSMKVMDASSPPRNPSSSGSTVILSDLNAATPEVSNTSVLKKELAVGFTPYDSSIIKQFEKMLFATDTSDPSCRLDKRPVNTIPASQMPLHTSQTAKYTHSIKEMSQSTQIPADPVTDASKISDASGLVLPTASDEGPPRHKQEPMMSSNHTSTSAGKTHVSTIQPPNANPTMQESFFKSVHKRLQLLESNSTLSLQYIEEQSRILRDAFSKVEKRQLAKSTTFLETLNDTVLTELREFRNQYDQIWQSTVLELSSQREQSQHEVLALSARLSFLADEIVFQKRMVILQFVLILLCLGLVIFSRSTSSARYLELPPVVQNAIGKSSASFLRYSPRFESPQGSPSPTRPTSRYGLFRGLTHRRGRSDESQMDEAHIERKSLEVEYSPPTPTSQDSPEDQIPDAARAYSDESLNVSFLHAEADAVRQTKSSPATPSVGTAECKEFTT